MHTITIIIGPGQSGGLDSAEIRGWITLLAAISAAIFAYRALRRENKRDKVAAEARLKEQASKFSGWLEYYNEIIDGEKIELFAIKVKNASSLPIENVTAWLWEGERHKKTSFLQVAAREDPIYMFGTVPPDAEIYGKQRYDPAKVGVSLSLTFSDQQGKQWVRHDGSLEQETRFKRPEYAKESTWKAPHYLNAARARVKLIKDRLKSLRSSSAVAIRRALGFRRET